LSGPENNTGAGRARILVTLAAIIALPALVLLAFYASLNVTATNEPLFGKLSLPSGLFFTATFNQTVTTTIQINMSSFQNGSLNSFFPSITIPPDFLTAIFLIVLVVVSLSIVLNMRRQSAGTISGFSDADAELEKQRNKVADILEKAATELRQGGEYRQTVLECYRQICEILEARSKIDGTPLTAREFETSVSSALKINSPYLSQITDVFELARYSNHEITREEADIAIDCLSNLGAALRGSGSTS
jgi:hypothetical protein